MYPSLPKYFRSSTQQHHHHQQQQMSTPSHHQHMFSLNGSNMTHKFNANHPPVRYSHVQPVTNSGYAPSQRSTTHNLQKVFYGNGVQRQNSAASELCRNYWTHNHKSASASIVYKSERHHSKRKSAVELLAETKQFFVKSDLMMTQRTNYSTNDSTFAVSNKRGRNNGDSMALTEGKYNPGYGETQCRAGTIEGRRSVASTPQYQHRRPTHIHHHHRHNHASSGCRTLITMPTNFPHLRSASHKNKVHVLLGSDNARDSLTNLRSQPYGGETINLNEAKAVSFEEDMAVRLPPPLNYSLQSLDNNMYESGDEPLVLTENYRPISPPAEYAEDPVQSNRNGLGVRHNYQRSYSHSHEMADDKAKRTATSYNINSHKSLPDLHTQINRHSPHSEILSCCSRGNRSIKSTGESSLNRDSGGSSGHYTHRSEPCYRQYREIIFDPMNGSKKCCSATNRAQYRRDSGSSTQHSNISYCEYACKAEMEKYDFSDYLLNFTTPEVPEAFQDNYVPPTPHGTPKYANEEAMRFSYIPSSQPPRIICGSGRGCNTTYMKYKSASDEPIVQSPVSTLSIEDISPPPIQFRRQKCIRLKNHNRISLPQPNPPPITNANDTNRESHRRSEPLHYFFPKFFSAEDYSMQVSKDGRESTLTICKPLRRSQEFQSLTEPPTPAAAAINLEKFFDRLGLQDDKFHEIYTFSQRRHSESGGDGGVEGEERMHSDSENSTVFFSDVSTVDSMRLPDSTETQGQSTQAYRPTEPPSIVERNARIIKWLCNIRKAQGEIV